MKTFQIIAALTGLLLVACGGADLAGEVSDTSPPVAERPTTVPEEPTTVPEPAPIPPTEGGVVQPGAVPQQIIDQIRAEASTATPAAPETIEVALAEAVLWSDGSLGCPQPGMAYTQALVEGYRVVLEADGELLDYRTSQTGSITVCEQ